MTKQEAIEKLNALYKHGDTEAAHGEADDVLCELLRSLGLDDVVDAYSKIEKWYA